MLPGAYGDRLAGLPSRRARLPRSPHRLSGMIGTPCLALPCLAVLSILAAPLRADSSDTPVTVQSLSGNEKSGKLLELDEKTVVLRTDEGQKSYKTRELQALLIHDGGTPSPRESLTYVELVDGTRLAGREFTVQDGTAKMKLGDRSVSIETADIHTVRFHAASKELENQWREITTAESQGDVIVLRRSESAIDQLEGIFGDVTAEVVEFEYDGELIPVKRPKLEGMMYHHPPGRELDATACKVEELGSTVWQAASLEIRDGGLHVSTPTGVASTLPWKRVTRLNYSASNMAYLSDQEFELAECTPYLGSQLPEERIRQLYAPHRNASFEGEGLWLADGQQVERYQKGLAIHSRTRIVYRLTEPYRRLRAVVGIDSRLGGRGNLVLVVKGDDNELFRRTFSGQDPPVTVDLNIEGVRRLSILVDYGESLDIADHLNLCNARIIK